MDHPHEAFGLIGSSRMLVRRRTFSTADTDRTPSIGVCQFFGYSGSSAEIVERLMKLSLKFGRLTILIAYLLTFRTLGRNPRVLTIGGPFLSSFLFFSFFSHVEGLSHATLSLSDQITHAPPSLSF